MQLLKIPKEGDSVISIRNICQCLVTLTVKRLLPDVQKEPPVFKLVPTASCPVSFRKSFHDFSFFIIFFPHRATKILQRMQKMASVSRCGDS